MVAAVVNLLLDDNDWLLRGRHGLSSGLLASTGIFHFFETRPYLSGDGPAGELDR